MAHGPITSGQIIRSTGGGRRRAASKSYGARKPVTPVCSLKQPGVIWNLV